MSANRFYILTNELIPWSAIDERDWPWPDCRYFGEVFAAVDEAGPASGLRFVLTDRIEGTLPLHGDDVVVVCIRDELSRIPTYAHDVRLVAKTYGIKRTPNALAAAPHSLPTTAATLAQEAIVHAKRARTLVRSAARSLRRGSGPRVIDVPLGTYLLQDVPFVPFDARSFDVSYAGSRYTRQTDAQRLIPSQKMRSRRELEAALDRLVVERPEWDVGVHIIDTFHDAAAHQRVYSQMLMDSRMVLCPRGGSLETYRFFEALRFGAVPVVERLPARDFYVAAPAVRVRSWSDLPSALEPLITSPERLQAMHEAALSWWRERCSPRAFALRLLTALGVAGQLSLSSNFSCVVDKTPGTNCRGANPNSPR